MYKSKFRIFGAVMNAINAVAQLYKRGIKTGTERTRAILNELDSPDNDLKIIHVAGTNGKGSVTEYLTQILIAAGKTVGTFQSPAVYDYFGQFRINGLPIAEEELEKAFKKVIAPAEKYGATGFEAETAGAILAFKNAGVEYAVIECGMGGLNDATNAVAKKELAVITSIGLEHTAYLGNTIEEICAQKAGIIKDCPAVVSALQTDETKAYFGGKGAIFADKPIEIIKSDLNGQSFLYGNYGFFTQMAGDVQPYNAACAIEAARLLKIEHGAIYTGIKAAKLPARAEVLRANGTTYLLDGAHNPPALRELARLLKRSFKPEQTAIIFGCLADKDVCGNVSALAGTAEKIIAVHPQNPRGMDLEKIFSACTKYFKNAVSAADIPAAIQCAAGFKNTVICGTFTTLPEAKRWIEKEL